MIDVKFTEDENQMRKKWLFWAIKLPAFMIGCLIVVTLIRSFVSLDFMGVMAIFGFSLLFRGILCKLLLRI